MRFLTFVAATGLLSMVDASSLAEREKVIRMRWSFVSVLLKRCH